MLKLTLILMGLEAVSHLIIEGIHFLSRFLVPLLIRYLFAVYLFLNFGS